jgi:hypothetical protein
MKAPNRRSFVEFVLTFLTLSAFAVVGCSDDISAPKKGIEPFVGKWRAQSMVLTNLANPSVSVDLVEEGATFTLSILATGQYSASLAAFGQSNTEFGTIEVSGSQVTITPTSPAGPPLVAAFVFQGDLLILDGASVFDFNRDGTSEAATAHIELYLLES